jgi:hypothetical protein
MIWRLFVVSIGSASASMFVQIVSWADRDFLPVVNVDDRRDPDGRIIPHVNTERDMPLECTPVQPRAGAVAIL